MALCVAVAVYIPFLVAGGFFYFIGGIKAGMVPAVPVVIYASLVLAAFLLITLDRLLRNIRKGDVFIFGNVKALRMISWTCFAVAILMLVSGIVVSLPFLAISIAAGFFGLIIRVVKNVIAAAVELKNENDYTI